MALQFYFPLYVITVDVGILFFMKNRVGKYIIAAWYKNKVIVTPFYSTLKVILK